MNTKNATEIRNEKIESLLSELAEMSKQAYKPEYFEKKSKWEKIGMALTYITDSGKDIAELACSFFEDWNFHNAAFVLDWMFKIYPPTNPKVRAFCHVEELNRIKDIFNKNVWVWEWDKNHEIVEKKYRVIVTIEEVE